MRQKSDHPRRRTIGLALLVLSTLCAVGFALSALTRLERDYDFKWGWGTIDISAGSYDGSRGFMNHFWELHLKAEVPWHRDYSLIACHEQEFIELIWFGITVDPHLALSLWQDTGDPVEDAARQKERDRTLGARTVRLWLGGKTWVFFYLASFGPYIWLLLYRPLRRRRRERNGYCGQCGYSLRGAVSERCSECGAVISERSRRAASFKSSEST